MISTFYPKKYTGLKPKKTNLPVTFANVGRSNADGTQTVGVGQGSKNRQPVQSLVGGGVGYRTVPKPSTPTTTYKAPEPTIPDARTQRFGEEQSFAKQFGQVQNEAFDNSKKFMESQRPYYEQGIQGEKDLAKSRLAEIDRRLGQDIESTNEQADVSTRNLSKTKQVTDAQRLNKFANLGTLESTGYFGFTGQQTNADEQFNTDLANLEKERLRVVGDAKAQSQQDRMIVEKQMNETIAQYKSELDKINYSLADNETARKQATLKLQDALRQRLYAVADEFDARETQRQKDVQEAELQAQKYNDDLELEKLKAGGNEGGSSEATQNVVSVIDKLLGADTKPITGLSQVGSYIPGNPAKLTASYFDQLQGLLSLENRAALKGSGAISDYEARTLEKAASALNRNLSDEDFRKVLIELRTGLSGAPTQNPQSSVGQGGAFNIDGYIVEEL